MHTTSKELHRSPARRLRVLSAGAYEAPQAKDFPFHQHTTWELVYYRSGNIEFLLGDETLPVEPGTLVLAPPHIPHAERALTAYENYFISVVAPPHIGWPRRCFDDEDQSLNRLCKQIVNEFHANKTGRREMLGLLTAQLAIAITRATGESRVSSQERIVRKAEVIIGNHFSRPLRITEIAAQSGASVSSLRSHFSRLRGLSPLEYLQQVRLRRAVSFLVTSDLTLDQIAALSGYDSASHLSRRIKAAYGSSPGTFRRVAPGYSRGI